MSHIIIISNFKAHSWDEEEKQTHSDIRSNRRVECWPWHSFGYSYKYFFIYGSKCSKTLVKLYSVVVKYWYFLIADSSWMNVQKWHWGAVWLIDIGTSFTWGDEFSSQTGKYISTQLQSIRRQTVSIQAAFMAQQIQISSRGLRKTCRRSNLIIRLRSLLYPNLNYIHTFTNANSS